ncbi:uncharacterized protein LOC100969779 isoform X1 [Pan paniscus]|uniref:uncharacterized protein LOC100969779 isoform X1 n=1 Tax=Pan paniscus TaxID=9597 RepID=UPI00300722D1
MQTLSSTTSGTLIRFSSSCTSKFLSATPWGGSTGSPPSQPVPGGLSGFPKESSSFPGDQKPELTLPCVQVGLSTTLLCTTRMPYACCWGKPLRTLCFLWDMSSAQVAKVKKHSPGWKSQPGWDAHRLADHQRAPDMAALKDADAVVISMKFPCEAVVRVDISQHCTDSCDQDVSQHCTDSCDQDVSQHCTDSCDQDVSQHCTDSCDQDVSQHCTDSCDQDVSQHCTDSCDQDVSQHCTDSCNQRLEVTPALFHPSPVHCEKLG